MYVVCTHKYELLTYIQREIIEMTVECMFRKKS
jgi:hypothetical protein